MRARLAGEGKRFPLIGDDDATANRAHIKQFVLAHDRDLGERYGLRYVEGFRDIGRDASEVEDDTRRHAQPLR